MEAATSSYSATGEFLRYIYSVLVANNHHNIQSRCLVHEFSFTDVFFKCYFIWLLLLIAIMNRCAEQCVLQLYRTSLSNFFSPAELNNIEGEDEVFAKEFSCQGSDYGDSNDEDIEQLYIWQVK